MTHFSAQGGQIVTRAATFRRKGSLAIVGGLCAAMTLVSAEVVHAEAGNPDLPILLDAGAVIDSLPTEKLVDVAAPTQDVPGMASYVASDTGTVVAVPSAAQAGTELMTPEGESITITPPASAADGPGVLTDSGAVVYSGDQAQTSILPAENGAGVQMVTTIGGPEAPTEYAYDVAVPAGGQIVIAPDGGALVTDGTGEIVLVVPAPWAVDRDGASVPTFFTVDESKTVLTQVVEHHGRDIQYPVSADPVWFAISAVLFWAAVRRCGAGGSLSAVSAYLSGSRSKTALGAAAVTGCMSSFVGGTYILRQMVRVIRW